LAAEAGGQVGDEKAVDHKSRYLISDFDFDFDFYMLLCRESTSAGIDVNGVEAAAWVRGFAFAVSNLLVLLHSVYNSSRAKPLDIY
jgi:hypothetical protein